VTPTVFHPDVKYRHKLFLVAGLSGALVLAMSIALGVARRTFGKLLAGPRILGWRAPDLTAERRRFDSSRFL
jgi:hypothetical protein